MEPREETIENHDMLESLENSEGRGQGMRHGGMSPEKVQARNH